MFAMAKMLFSDIKIIENQRTSKCHEFYIDSKIYSKDSIRKPADQI